MMAYNLRLALSIQNLASMLMAFTFMYGYKKMLPVNQFSTGPRNSYGLLFA